jgi:hypothetical protein
MTPLLWRVAYFLLASGMLISTLCSAQQYMKLSTSTDQQFDDWIQKGQLVKCHAFPHTAYPDPPKGMTFGATDPRPSGICYWDIDRAAELSPSALIVHEKTRVLVRVKNLRQNEIITPAVVFAKVVPPSPGNDILKNAVNPLQAITPTPIVHTEAEKIQFETIKQQWTRNAKDTCDPTSGSFNADSCQSLLAQQVISIQASLNHANAALACLESYQVAVPSDPPEQITPRPDINAFTCAASTPIGSTPAANNFANQKMVVTDAITTATNIVTNIVVTFTTFDTFINTDKAKYAKQIVLDAQLKNAISALQSSQATLQQSFVVLLSIPDTVHNRIYYFDVPHLTTATVTITGVEIVSKTSSVIATWTTSSTSYDFVFSAGLGFSNLVSRTFANTPQLQNGTPVLNSSGNVISIVTETDTKLSVLAPEIVGSYVIPGLRRFSASCSFGCSVLVSGGIGANLITKSADFDTGMSLRFADVLITPAVHFGRETRLSDGITVGEQIGANAPSSLPTHTQWVRKFGIALTYVIPLP